MLRADRFLRRSLVLFDVDGVPLPALRRKMDREARAGEKKRPPRRPPGPGPSPLRVQLYGFLNGQGAGLPHLSADLAERFHVQTGEVSSVLGNMKRDRLVRSERIEGSSSRLWTAGPR